MFFRGRSSLRRRDDRRGTSGWSGAIHVVRAALKKDGPMGDGSKPSPEKNGTPISLEVNQLRHIPVSVWIVLTVFFAVWIFSWSLSYQSIIVYTFDVHDVEIFFCLFFFLFPVVRKIMFGCIKVVKLFCFGVKECSCRKHSVLSEVHSVNVRFVIVHDGNLYLILIYYMASEER